MNLTLPSLFLGSTVSCMGSMSLIQNSISYLLELTRPSTSHTHSSTKDSPLSIQRLRSCFTVLLRILTTSLFLKDRNKPVIFSITRLDRVKNITGLVELYGRNPRLRELVNLVVLAGDHGKESKDLEEQAEMKKMYSLIEQYKLDGYIRWISARMNRVRNGELYRCICDTKGALVQPAFYEAFGLTVVESRTCGLPTFATSHGGPAEIIVHGVSGFHIDPYEGDKAAELLLNFFVKCKEDATHWNRISGGGLQRIEEKYTWKLYSERLMTLSGVYGFWKYVSNLDRDVTSRYLGMFYALKYRTLVKSVPLHFDGEVVASGTK